MPHLLSHSIHAVSGHLGYSVTKLKKSADHVMATKFILENMPSAEVKGSEKRQQREKNYLEIIERRTRLSWPKDPGVYKMFAPDRTLLYVGKAKNINTRLNSYFRGKKTKGGRLNEMLSQVHNVEIEPLASENEALIRECCLIDQLQPKYNKALQSDASLPIAIGRLALFSEHKDEQLYTLKNSAISELDGIYTKSEDSFLFQLFSERMINKQMASLGKLQFDKRRLPASFEDRIKNIFGLYWLTIQRYDTSDLITKGIDWDELYEEDPEEFIVEYLHNTFLKSALELQKQKWLRRIADSTVTVNKGCDSEFIVRFDQQSSRVSVKGTLNYRLPYYNDGNMSRADYNKLTTIFSILKRKDATRHRLNSRVISHEVEPQDLKYYFSCL
jgi:hypothetical protein